MPSFAAADGTVDGADDEGQLALQERHARRAGPAAPVVCAYARGVYDGVRLAVTLLEDGAAPHPAPAVPRLALADGLAFRGVRTG
jgi:hypothetical protein